MNKIRGAIFAAEQVENGWRKFGSAQEYVPSYLIQAGSPPRALLWTKDEISVALERAQQNPEDCPPFEPEEQRIAAAVEDAVIEAMRDTPVVWKAERDWLVPAIAIVALCCGFALGALL